MLYRIALLGWLFVVSACGSKDSLPQQTQTDPIRPNIILIIADDLGWGEVGYNGSHISTPHIDTLAEQGVKLNRFYVYPTCSQTRATLMTGRGAGVLGLYEPIQPWSSAGLPEDTPTIAELLNQSGYATWLVGKWHLGHHTLDRFPHRRGFDYAYGNLGGEVDYYAHTMVGQLDWQRNGEIVEESGHATDLLTHDAIRLLQAHEHEQPFFLVLSYTAPHTPLQPKDEFVEPYAKIDNPNKQRIAGLVDHMDESIGKVIETVRGLPDAENTLVLFLSDNGAMLPFGGDNGKLRGSKASTYEGGTRVPAVAWWPARLPAQTVETALSVHDLFPTIAALGEAAVPDDGHYRPGVDVWSAIESQTAIKRDHPIAFELLLAKWLYFSVYHDHWKLVASNTAVPPRLPPEMPPLSYELFNLAEDPFERSNLAGQNPEQLQKMIAKLEALDLGKPVRLEPPPRDWQGPLIPSPEADHHLPIRRPDVVAAAKANERRTDRSSENQ